MIERGFIEAAGLRIHAAYGGRGRPVVLLHGLGATAYSWRRLLPELERRHSVLAFDWPGHGRSDKPLDFDYSPQGYHRFLLALLERLGLVRPALVGNSLGGFLSLWTAMETPERLGRLVLIGTPAYLEDRPRLLWPLRWPVIGRLYEMALGPWAIAPIARSVFTDPAVVTPELVEEYGAALRARGGRAAIARFLRNAVPADAAARVARYPQVSAPTLVMVGDRDCMVPVASARRLAAAMPRAALAVLEGCGHAPQEDRPDRVLGPLLEFLGQPDCKIDIMPA